MWTNTLLSQLICLPILGGFLTLLAGPTPETASRARWFACGVALLCMGLSLLLWQHFDVTQAGLQFVENREWIPSFGVQYALGVDGLATALIMLTCFTTVVIVIAAWRMVETQVAQYMAAFLIMQGLIIGVFAATNALLFYVFWEGMLIPMYLIIGVWGSSNRSYAAIKFFLYTFLGSALMLIAFLYLYTRTGGFVLDDFYRVKLDAREQCWIFWAFFLAFAVKIPMWPVHTWLPDAHTEAPAGGSVILAAIMLKMGAYGFLRFMLPIVPDASQHYAGFMIALSLVAIVYIGFVAIVQTDMKRLIAYSSIAHMGMVTLGCFILFTILKQSQDLDAAALAMNGAIVQMISHAFTSSAMFIGVGILYARVHSRNIEDFGGVVQSMPVFAALFMLFAMANVGLPGTSGFVGEFMVILASFKASFALAALAATTLILAAGYTLWMYKRVFFGSAKPAHALALTDVRGSESLALVLLAIPVLFVGIYPKPLIQLVHVSTDTILSLAQLSKGPL